MIDITTFQEECQKQHFAVHKKNCRSIHKQEAILEEDWASRDENRLSQRCVDLGDLLVKTAYGESDSIAGGARYYREALKYYLLPMTKFPEYLSRNNFPWVEDCILLLVLVLGGDHTTVKDWSFSVGSERLKRCYRPASELCCEGDWDVYDADLEDGVTPDFELAGYATDDVTFQAVQLLGKLKKLNEINNHVDALKVVKEVMETAASDLGPTVSVDDVVNHTGAYLLGDVRCCTFTKPDDEVEINSALNCAAERHELIHSLFNVMASIWYHGSKHGQTDGPTEGMPYMLNLVKGTFNKECALTMFGGGLGNLPQYYSLRENWRAWLPPNHAPDELWMILRDFFAETPGLQRLLETVMGIGNQMGKITRERSVDEDY